ncbi:hypothetical protein B0T22DRAFT_449218 [Podospora appendiculata]|uniref:U1-C C2H2-type zinc finger domain-containing protein n=1 Tax=Podospora appendiculata TaxID=314037 RepID=A0AAE0XH97_9PEZI|nr:hypothetical protein B0T22DRAFT_449218 [Podospora appendiculata]
MSEYWKSTPKYWCKHCAVYVRDTKLERSNHESTGKHQGAIKRSLRDLHRGAEQKERDAERAKREVERLNGVVSGLNGGGGSSASLSAAALSTARPSRAGGGGGAAAGVITEAERQRQLEQLAELGVAIPTELRPTMAMPGEWTVTATRVIENNREEGGEVSAEARATGVKRERERTEEEKEQEEAIKGLFKRSRRWGVDSKAMPAEEDEELERLLSGPLAVKAEVKGEVKKEDGLEGVRKEEGGLESIKKEESRDEIKGEEGLLVVKKEEDGEEIGVGEVDAAPAKEDVGLPAGLFKKRKPKHVRQK